MELKQDNGVRALYRFECSGCRRFHNELCHPDDFMRRWESWAYKHSLPTCQTRPIKLWHRIPKRFNERSFLRRVAANLGQTISDWMLPWYLRTWDFDENTNFQLAFNASSTTAITTTNLASLASDTNLLAGWSGPVVDNGASATLLDVALGCFIKAGSVAPTAGQAIYVYAWTTIDDTPTYPDTITGSDATITLTSANVRDGFMRPVAGFTVDATANRVYYSGGNSIRGVFGCDVRKWGPWVVQNSGQALGASGHQFTIKQSYVAG